MKEHTPSFFKNSNPGNHAFVETKRPTCEETDEVVTGGPSASSALVASDEEIYARRRSVAVGGFTCCVPGCFSNSKRDTNLSFYNIPNGKSKDKQLLCCSGFPYTFEWQHLHSQFPILGLLALNL